MKNAIISIILIIILFYNISAQTTEKFSGKYNFDLFKQSGEMEYQYKVVDYKNVKNGTFSATFNGTGNYEGCKLSVTGNYSDDLKSGKWIHTFVADGWFTNNKYLYSSADLKANYSEGLPNGAFSLNYEMKSKRNKTADLEEGEIVEFTANFDKGIFIDNFYVSKTDNRIGSVFEITAVLDKKGFIKTLTINDKGTVTSETYIKGVIKNEFYDENSEKLTRYEKCIKSFPDSIKYLDFMVDTFKIKSVDNILNNIFSFSSQYIGLNELDGGDKFYNGKFNSPHTNSMAKLTYQGFYYLEFAPKIPDYILPVIDTIEKTSIIFIKQINENLKSFKNSDNEMLTEIKTEFSNLFTEITTLQRLKNDAVAYYSGKTNTKQTTLLNYESENKEYSYKILNIIFSNLNKNQKIITELVNKKQTALFDSYYENAINYYNNMDYKNCVSFLNSALYLARNNAVLELDTTAVFGMKEKADVQNNLQLAFNELTVSLQNLEILFKAPPRKDEEIKTKQKIKLEDTYGDYYYRFDKEYSIRNYLQSEIFPADTVNLEFLFINSTEYKAMVWNKNIKEIYKSYVFLVEDFRLKLISETNTEKRSDLASNLNYFLIKYNEILSSEEDNLIEYNKKLKSAEDDLELIKQILGI